MLEIAQMEDALKKSTKQSMKIQKGIFSKSVQTFGKIANNEVKQNDFQIGF